MNIAIVYAHPNEESLSNALLQAFKRGSKRAKHNLQVIDLYKDNFDPVLKTVQRTELIDPMVERYQKILKKADWIVYIFPIWWFCRLKKSKTSQRRSTLKTPLIITK